VKTTKLLPLDLLLLWGMVSCTNNSITCNLQEAIVATTVASHPCTASGSIQVAEPLGAKYQYRIDNRPFQNQPIFSDVKVGGHRLVLKDVSGCEAVREVMVDTIAQVNTFKQVRQILANRCASCHSGNNPHGGLDFTNFCDILNHWQRIDARAVQGIPSPMPQAGLIPQEERNKIVEWIKTGHSYSN
jgi:mono/diheme cytochrome c family protein